MRFDAVRRKAARNSVDSAYDCHTVTRFNQTRKMPCCEKPCELRSDFGWSRASAANWMDTSDHLPFFNEVAEIDHRFDQPLILRKGEAIA